MSGCALCNLDPVGQAGNPQGALRRGSRQLSLVPSSPAPNYSLLGQYTSPRLTVSNPEESPWKKTKPLAVSLDADATLSENPCLSCCTELRCHLLQEACPELPKTAHLCPLHFTCAETGAVTIYFNHLCTDPSALFLWHKNR